MSPAELNDRLRCGLFKRTNQIIESKAPLIFQTHLRRPALTCSVHKVVFRKKPRALIVETNETKSDLRQRPFINRPSFFESKVEGRDWPSFSDVCLAKAISLMNPNTPGMSDHDQVANHGRLAGRASWFLWRQTRN